MFSFKVFNWILTQQNNRIPEIVERAKKLRVSGGEDPKADIGPVVSKKAKERIEKLIQSGVDSGAKLVLDGRNIKVYSFSSWFNFVFFN